MTIIAATDFSPVAANAVRTAVELGRKLGDAVVLVRVLQPIVEVHPELRVPESAVFDAALREANEGEMRKAVSAAAQEGVQISGRTQVGSPAQALSDVAKETGARLIVMGLRPHGALSRLVTGSVAERTVLGAPCAVLVVPESATPFSDWASGKRPLRALVGLDLDSATPAVLDEIAKLRAAGPCDATFVHTYWPPAEYTRLGQCDAEGRPVDPFKPDPQVVAVLEREIRARVALPAGPGTSTLRIESAWGPVGDALGLDARAERADLLVVGTQQPHGWDRIKNGSAAVGSLRASPTAVLCVPAKEVPAPAQKAAIPIIKTVLCATDLSDLGNAAVPHAYALVRGTGGIVELCHIHQRTLPPVPLYDLPERTLSPDERQQIEARLWALVPPEARELGISTRVAVALGSEPALAITQAARRLGADTIVLASHGRTGIARTVMGSVAEAVLRGSDRPVLVVRAGQRAQAAGQP